MRKSAKCSVFRAKHKDFPEVGLIVRVYENCAVNLMNMLYLKILKHIGKKHPYIVQTWDIFKTEKNLIMVFQEYANRNDLQQYLERSDSPGEKQICEWARELYQAMDYLGDMGVCHLSKVCSVVAQRFVYSLDWIPSINHLLECCQR